MDQINNIIGAILVIVFLAVAMHVSEAFGDTEFDERANGYTGYDYDRKAWIDVDRDPTGGYDVYDWQTREYSDVEESTGGFTVFGDSDEKH